MAVQVKAINGRTWQFDIRKFADVQLCNEKGEQSKDGERQIVGQRKPEPFPDLMCVLVALKPEATGQDRFFVLEWKELQDILVRSYEAYLTKHGNRRPRAPGSFHTALAIDQAAPFEDKWDKICDRVPKPNWDRFMWGDGDLILIDPETGEERPIKSTSPQSNLRRHGA